MFQGNHKYFDIQLYNPFAIVLEIGILDKDHCWICVDYIYKYIVSLQNIKCKCVFPGKQSGNIFLGFP